MNKRKKWTKEKNEKSNRKAHICSHTTNNRYFCLPLNPAFSNLSFNAFSVPSSRNCCSGYTLFTLLAISYVISIFTFSVRKSKRVTTTNLVGDYTAISRSCNLFYNLIGLEPLIHPSKNKIRLDQVAIPTLPPGFATLYISDNPLSMSGKNIYFLQIVNSCPSCSSLSSHTP